MDEWKKCLFAVRFSYIFVLPLVKEVGSGVTDILPIGTSIEATRPPTRGYNLPSYHNELKTNMLFI